MSNGTNNEFNFPVVSSNTLFHFVTQPQFLDDILRSNFRARYCYEDLNCLTPNSVPNLGPVRDFAIPMKCFCDIPLSLTARHLSLYGPYGIGLTKEWGMRNGLNPILYLHADSSLRKRIEENIAITNNIVWAVDRDGINKLAKAPIDADTLSANFDYMLFFSKPYEGPFVRNGETIQVRFYDEREWRFVPRNLENKPWKQFIRGDAWAEMDSDKRESHNLAIYSDEDAVLKFSPNDVRYIIVRSDEELIEWTQKIDTYKAKYDWPDQVRLKTRLISAEQILTDF